jgi:hypothetical protein
VDGLTALDGASVALRRAVRNGSSGDKDGGQRSGSEEGEFREHFSSERVCVVNECGCLAENTAQKSD